MLWEVLCWAGLCCEHVCTIVLLVLCLCVSLRTWPLEKKKKNKGVVFGEGEGKGFVNEGIFLQVVWECGGDGV